MTREVQANLYDIPTLCGILLVLDCFVVLIKSAFFLKQYFHSEGNEEEMAKRGGQGDEPLPACRLY